MKIKTAEATPPLLDWLVAKAEGRVLREPVTAKYEDVTGIPVPFYLREVVSTYLGGTLVAAEVKDIKVTRCGIDLSVGATAPSITFIGSDGQVARGSIGMFFISQEEAELEATRQLHGDTKDFHPSTDWAQGGPIIDREGICFSSIRQGRKIVGWRAAFASDGKFGFDSSTSLIAAMRCWAASKLGDEVEIPEELK